MRIVVLGAGGVGGYFGGRLAHSGEDVTFIARGAHLDALRREGLHVDSPTGGFVVSPSNATDRTEGLARVEVVLLGVKAWQVPEAAASVREVLSAHGVVVPLQNGVEAPQQVARAVGIEHAAGGLCIIISMLAGAGRIRHLGGDPYIAFGELDNHRSERLLQLEAAFKRAGVRAEIPRDIEVAMWRKFLTITAFAGLGAITRCPIGDIRSLPDTRAVLEQAMEEIVVVAGAHGIDVGEHAKTKALETLDGLEPGSTASMQRDIADGGPSELEYLTGAVVRLGREVGVATPVNELIYACLLPSERRARRPTTHSLGS